MLGWLILLFVTVPILEIWILLELAEPGVLGIGPTVGLVLVTGVVGGAVARWQGTTALKQIVDAAAAGEVPGDELAAGALFVAGAAFLLTPGVLTDVAGFLLMVPRLRLWAAGHLIHHLKENATAVRVEVRTPREGGAPGVGEVEAPEGPKRVDADARVRDDDGEGD